MPLYEFVCDKCNNAFEEMCAYSEIEDMKCPECKGKAKKQLSIPTIAFKGSGFYKTDSVSYGGGGGSTTESTPAVETTSAPAPKTEGLSKGKIKREGT